MIERAKREGIPGSVFLSIILNVHTIYEIIASLFFFIGSFVKMTVRKVCTARQRRTGTPNFTIIQQVRKSIVLFTSCVLYIYIYIYIYI